MPTLTPDQIVDFVNLTLPKFERKKWTDLSMEYTEYISAEVINAHKVMEDGGPSIDFKIKTRNTGNARVTGLFAEDVMKVEDVTIGASVGWTYQTTNWSFDIYEEKFQSDRETILSVMKVREHDAYSDMAELQEELMWTAPTSTTDGRPGGIPFWLQKDATTAPDGGFNGGNPSTHPNGRAGVNSTTYPRWRNWTFGYNNVTGDDMVVKAKRALAFTNFTAPVPHPEPGFGNSKYQIYTTYRVTEPCERLAESRNDNLGSDLAKYLNQVTIGGVPMKWVPYLENNDTSDPIYGVNWSVIRPFVKKGLDMARGKVRDVPGQHTVRAVHIDHAMNWVCFNLRRCFVGSKS